MKNAQFIVPTADEYGDFYETYISRFQPTNFLEAFRGQIDELFELLGDLPEGEDSRCHEPYTWSLKQLMGHLIDCERIFSTRLLRIAVNDLTPIPGIEHTLYVDNLDYESVAMRDLLDEFGYLRKSNALLASRLSREALSRRGTASDLPVSANANLFIMGGHVAYHLEIIRKRLNQ